MVLNVISSSSPAIGSSSELISTSISPSGVSNSMSISISSPAGISKDASSNGASIEPSSGAGAGGGSSAAGSGIGAGAGALGVFNVNFFCSEIWYIETSSSFSTSLLISPAIRFNLFNACE